DIEPAVDQIKKKSEVSRVCLVGFRLGGTLSIMHGSSHGNIDRIILLDPVINGKNYLGELADIHESLLSDSHLTPGPRPKNQLPSEVQGFPLTDVMITDLMNIDLLGTVQKPADNILIIKSGADLAKGNFVEHLETMGVRLSHLFSDSGLWKDRQAGEILVPVKVLEVMASWMSEVYP
ncbi:MAG: hypothetical protein HQK57_09725, partial [Deltaproteobacteria bacterium]|nr:hypothetical protein [Deltaproteobacteria bacterium]